MCLYSRYRAAYLLTSVCVYSLYRAAYLLTNVCVYSLYRAAYLLTNVCVYSLYRAAYLLTNVCVYSLYRVTYLLTNVCVCIHVTERPIYSSESDASEGSNLDESRSKRLNKVKRLEDSDDVSHHILCHLKESLPRRSNDVLRCSVYFLLCL